jgi:ADP-heptose:LPS heptosyltransferase
VVLVLRALGLGDLLAALPALRALRDHLPGSILALAAPAWLAPLALRSGAVDRLLPTEPPGPVPLRSPALAVNLHGRGPQSHRRLLATRPGRLVAFHHPDLPETAASPRWRAGEHEVPRWCRLLTESGIPGDPSRLHLDSGPFPPSPAPGATLIHPGAGGPARRWPAERWAAVARRAAREDPVVVTAGTDELELAHTVASLAGLDQRAVWSGGLLELAGLVAAAGRVLSADTGVAHLATALARPSVVLFGPVSPLEWGPPPDPRHRVLWSGRRGDPAAARPDPGLLEIEPADVLRALRELGPCAQAHNPGRTALVHRSHGPSSVRP